jgi:hypothetical protein
MIRMKKRKQGAEPTSVQGQGFVVTARKSLFWWDKFGRWVSVFVVTYEVSVSGIQIEFPVHLKKIRTE